MNFLKIVCVICKTEVKRQNKGICYSCEKKLYQGPSKAWLEKENAVKKAYHTRYYSDF